MIDDPADERAGGNGAEGVGAVQTEHGQDPGTGEAGRQGLERRGGGEGVF